jgi:hypothetical protein
LENSQETPFDDAKVAFRSVRVKNLPVDIGAVELQNKLNQVFTPAFKRDGNE